jgi:uncharacterized protein (TIGR02099 family)
MTSLNEALKDALDESLDTQLPPQERRWLKWLRRAGWTLASVYFVLAVAMLALRFIVLPGVADYKDDIAAAVSRALGEKVTIASIDAEWYGLHPRLELGGVKIFDRRGQEALELPYVAVSVAWRSLVARELRFDSIVLDGTELRIRRDPDRRLYIAGLEVRLDAGGADDGLADWLLDQGEIHIRNAVVEWQDDYRGAPPLRLERLDFVLENDGRHHRFALRAEPPREYASALDLRGDFLGRSVKELAEWDGRVYAGFDSVDLAAWKTWVDYPFEVKSGRGALQLWIALADQRLTELSASVSLAEVATRFAPELPPFEASTVHGRFGFKERAEGLGLLGIGAKQVIYDAFARDLRLATPAGIELAPADFTARWEPAQGSQLAQGELVAKSIELAPLALLAERVPLPEALRKAVSTAAPQGRITDVRLAWTGEVERPASYSARGKFAGLGMLPYGELPGFDHLSGAFELTERGGSVTLAGSKTTITDAGVFIEESIAFDTLAARLSWSFPRGAIEFRIEELTGANAELSGTVTGVVRGGGKGVRGVDITARVPKADGKAVYKYIPNLGRNTAAWLKRGILAGTVTDVRLHLQGDLGDFPFDDAKAGEFKASGRVSGGRLAYAPGWPAFNEVVAELLFDGRRLKITSPRGSVFGVHLADVTVTSPDYLGADPQLRIDGHGEGPLGDYLRFIAQSPVREFIDGATDGWSGEGRTKLVVGIDLPIDRTDDSKVTGSFQFAGNTINMGPDEPLLAQVNGRVEFTDSGVSSKGLTAHTLGGTIAVQLATRDGTVTSTSQGTIDSTQLLRLIGVQFADRVRGPMQYSETTVGRGPLAKRVFESSLAGVAVDLPEPFAKAAADAAPLRIERVAAAEPGAAGGAGPVRERVTATVGSIVNAQAILRADGPRRSLERAAIGVGDVGVQLPERPGVIVSANLKTLDLDRLLPLFGDAAGTGTASDAAVTALNVRAGRLDVIGRQFHDVTVRARFGQHKTWQATVTSREMAGDVSWNPEGKGAVVARLTHLVLPDAAPDPVPGSGTARELPALSVVADSFVLNGRTLGRFELEAVNAKTDWRLDKLELSAPEGRMSAQGSWRPALRGAEHTDLDVRIETSDAGKFLTRFGQPDTIANGTAKLGGKVTWAGPIFAIDYPTLTGQLEIQAARGQFLKVQPGLGKLLGVVSLQSIPRRMSLDFKDIFSEGFAFDEVNGTAAIMKGVATTKNLTMVGPAASVTISGTANLAQETQDLNVRVVPAVGDSVAAAAALALLNPIVGVGALLAQRLLKDPLGQLLAFEYQVTGAWEDPKVQRVGAPADAATAGPKPEVQNP